MVRISLLKAVIIILYFNSYCGNGPGYQRAMEKADSFPGAFEAEDTIPNMDDGPDPWEEEIRFYNSQNPQIGISLEKLFAFNSDLKEINSIKLTWSKLKLNNISLQISGGIGFSNDLESSNLADIIDGKIKDFNLDLSLKRHFLIRNSHTDYFLSFGFTIDLLKWKYKESYELQYDGYSVLEYKDSTPGIGVYCGIGILSIPIRKFKFGLETCPGIIFFPLRTDNGLDNLLNNVCYLKIKIFLNYDARQNY